MQIRDPFQPLVQGWDMTVAALLAPFGKGALSYCNAPAHVSAICAFTNTLFLWVSRPAVQFDGS